MRANLGLSRLIEMSVNRDSESFDSIRVFQISIRFRSDFYFTLYVLSDWLIGKLKQKMAGKEAAASCVGLFQYSNEIRPRPGSDVCVFACNYNSDLVSL